MNKMTPTIAVLMGNRNEETARELMAGFHSCAKKENVNLVFLTRSSIPRDTNDILTDMTGEDFQIHFSNIYDYVPLFKPDVLILAYGTISSFADTPDMEKLLDYYKDIPIVLLKDISDRPGISNMTADNYSGMLECVNHLLVDHKYKRVAFVAGPKKNRDSSERLQAYKDAMHAQGLDVTEDMVVHGDYSEFVDAQVRYLLDQNPDLEAIVFANDNMAKAGYRVCEERGIRVGKNLAITGFDDIDMAKTVNPPLTSVMYSGFVLSYQALKHAIEIYYGENPTHVRVETLLHKRGSCGCSYGYNRMEFDHVDESGFLGYIYQQLDVMVEELFSYIPFESVKQEVREILVHFFEDFAEHFFYGDLERYTFDTQFIYLKKLCDNKYISTTIILDHMILLLRKMVSCVESEEVRGFILRIMASTQQYMNSAEMSLLKTKNQKDRNHSWFVNVFVQDLLVPEMSLEDGLACIMKRFQSMDIKKCYFFLFKEPAQCESAFYLSMDSKAYLAAYYENKKVISLLKDDWVPLNDETGVSDLLSKEGNHVYTTYVLFSAAEQYGFMVCENEQEDTPFVLECSLQVGSFLRFCHLNASEQDSKKELEASLKLIKEQNIILNSISKIDNLTNLLNRRGFMEHAMRCIKEHEGETAYVLFADLDHLKEINDTFGHPAGDFAISTAADYLRGGMTEDAIIARIGGDEFVSLVISNEKDYGNKLKQKIKQISAEFNENCDKPYYVEISVGVHECVCDPEINIMDLLQKSDTLLYEEKKHRKASIKK